MYITSISGNIPFTNNDIYIELRNKKNVIIIGDNGAGKTSFLNNINKYFEGVFSKSAGNLIESIDNDIEQYKMLLESAEMEGNYVSYYRYKSNLDVLKERRREFDSILNVQVDDIVGMIRESYLKNFFYYYFKSSRSINVAESTGSKSISEIKESWLSIEPSSVMHSSANNDLESYIVSLYTQEALQEKHNNKEKAEEISAWIRLLENTFSELMECDINFYFDFEKYKLFIVRNGVVRSSFRELSSGYSSILDIFTEIFFRASLSSINPHNMRGIVLIDEVDEHLHLSIQRKVIPILISAFPKIQFIITTHSPFVLGSSDEFIIFDISKNEYIPPLTMYSYENIVKNIMDVDVVSDELNNKINKIKLILLSGDKNSTDLKELLSNVEESLSELDSESKSINYTALNFSMGY